MLIGLQAGSGHLLGAQLLGEIRDQGFDLVRIQLFLNDEPHFTLTRPDVSRALVDEVLEAGLRPYVMIRRAEQVAAIAPDIPIVEFGNEPDLGARFGWPSAADYLTELRRTMDACDGRNPLFAGVVSNLNDRGFKFLEKMRWSSIPAWVGCAVHRYPDGDECQPRRPSRERRFRGPNHRDEEVAELRRIVGADRALGLSEIGYHTAAGQTDDQVAANMAWERGHWERHGFAFAIAYQVIDGPNRGEREHCYGFRRFTPETPLGPWKPVAAAWCGTATEKPPTAL